MKHKHAAKRIITTLFLPSALYFVLCASFLLFSLPAHATITDTLSHYLSTQITSHEQLINTFCQTALLQTPSHQHGTFSYDSTQSAFLFLLCTNNDIDATLFHPLLQTNSLFHKQQRNNTKRHKRSTSIFHDLLTDQTDLILATLYGTNSYPTDQNLDQQVLKRAATYFPGLPICDATTNCYFPTTYDHIKTYTNKANKLRKNTKLIDSQHLNTQLQEQCSKNKKLLRCALVDPPAATPLQNNINLLHNELFWFSLFATYYSHELAHNPQLQALSTDHTNNASTQKAYQLTTEVNRASQTIAQVTDYLTANYNTFPTHIGMLLYHESLLQFRNQYARIYTPLHQLDSTLRNVQTKS